MHSRGSCARQLAAMSGMAVMWQELGSHVAAMWQSVGGVLGVMQWTVGSKGAHIRQTGCSHVTDSRRSCGVHLAVMSSHPTLFREFEPPPPFKKPREREAVGNDSVGEGWSQLLWFVGGTKGVVLSQPRC
jgi:hypothetical protein